MVSYNDESAGSTCYVWHVYTRNTAAAQRSVCCMCASTQYSLGQRAAWSVSPCFALDQCVFSWSHFTLILCYSAGHPNAAGHRRMADMAVPVMKSVLGW